MRASQVDYSYIQMLIKCKLTIVKYDMINIRFLVQESFI